ncbi:MAG: hypothetical protein ABI224_01910 [Acetobacteraceae bacterium]
MTVRGARSLGPVAKRARLRAAAARFVAAHGLAGFNLHRLAPEAGIGFDLARHYYRTNEALIGDVVRAHHAALGERMADAMLAARGLAGTARVEALALALLEALAAEGDGHRTSLAAMAALPGVAEAARHGDAWLVDEFARAVGGDAVWGRSVVVLLGYWAGRLAVGDADGRAGCARVVAAMVGVGVGDVDGYVRPDINSAR